MDESSNDSTQQQKNERGNWSRKVEYFLSMVGYLVGLGNLWRFPYICMRNGGGAFLIPYILFLVFCGLPLFFLETALGQFSGKGPLHVWDICPLFKGIGYGMLVPLFFLNIYYNMIIAWTLYYIGNTFISPLPWTTCENKWNSQDCVHDRKLLAVPSNMSYSNGTLYSVSGRGNFSYYDTVNNTDTAISKKNISSWITPQEDFWQQNVLQISTGIDDIGHVNWHLLLSLLGSWIIVGLCIMKGVKSVGKVVYVTATLPYILLTIILVKGLTLDGSINGVTAYLWPKFEELLDFQVWIEAALQVFYSLGPGWGPLISMASFNKFDNNVMRDSVMLSLFGEGTSIYCGLVIFTVLGSMATTLSLPLDKIVKSGPGLGFIAYPEALSHLPGQNVWSCLFFVMLLTVGLDSQFAACEAVIVVFLDSFQYLRRRRVLLTFAFCAINFLLGIIFCTQGGIYIFQLIDWYVAAFALPLFGFLECIIICWIYGLDRFSQDVYLMLGRGIPAFFRICLCVVTPVILIILFISSLVGYKPPSYGSYTYPNAAAAVGIGISILPILPIPIFAFIEVKNSHEETFLKKLKSSLKPAVAWRPVCKEYNDDNQETEFTESTMLEKMKFNIVGTRI